MGEEAYCTKKPIEKEEGETCQRTTECKSRMCIEGKCSTLPDGAKCKKHFQCGQFSSFSNSVCKPLVKEGDAYDGDDGCGFKLACGNGKCQKMFSLESGEVSDNCNPSKRAKVKKRKSSDELERYTIKKSQKPSSSQNNNEKTCN